MTDSPLSHTGNRQLLRQSITQTPSKLQLMQLCASLDNEEGVSVVCGWLAKSP